MLSQYDQNTFLVILKFAFPFVVIVTLRRAAGWAVASMTESALFARAVNYLDMPPAMPALERVVFVNYPPGFPIGVDSIACDLVTHGINVEMELTEGRLYKVPRAELLAIADHYKIISCGGVLVKNWPDVGEARYCEEHERMELLFWMTDHISYDVPPEAFSDVREGAFLGS